MESWIVNFKVRGRWKSKITIEKCWKGSENRIVRSKSSYSAFLRSSYICSSIRELYARVTKGLISSHPGKQSKNIFKSRKIYRLRTTCDPLLALHYGGLVYTNHPVNYTKSDPRHNSTVKYPNWDTIWRPLIFKSSYPVFLRKLDTNLLESHKVICSYCIRNYISSCSLKQFKPHFAQIDVLFLSKNWRPIILKSHNII